MNSEETSRVLAIIQATFPTWKVSDSDREVTIKAWHTVLADYPYEQIVYALKAYIKTDTKGFAPSPGQLINMLVSHASASAALNEGVAWAMVHNAIRNGTYHSKEEYEKLPEDIQNAIGCHDQIRSWAMDTEFNAGVVESNFKRAYRQVLERKKKK